MRGKWAVLLLAGTFVVSAIIGTGASARTQLTIPSAINLSSNASRADIAKFLTSHGIDPKGIVIQRGAHNYAGPSCPGVGWTCTTAKLVVQFSTKDSNNQFQCTPSNAPGGFATYPGSCRIVQISSGGNNNAQCMEQTQDTSTTQNCVIIQSNTTGDNVAQINEQTNAHGGPSQSATQYGGTSQFNSSGQNVVQIQEQIQEQTNDSDSTGAQTQVGEQDVSVTQNSDTGNNHADVNQQLQLNEQATGKVAVVNQSQNATSSGPYTNAGISQTSNSGNNDAHLNQSNDFNANAPDKATGTETQGSPNGGLNGVFSQQSSGVSTVNASQNENQTFGGGKNSGVTQTQYGPAWFDPDQGSNPADNYHLNQNSNQQGSNSSTQSDQVFAECFTSGNCNSNQHVNQDGANEQNNCSGPSCSIGTSVVGGQGSTCGGSLNTDSEDEEGGCDTSFPPPPPPPIIGNNCLQSCDYVALNRG